MLYKIGVLKNSLRFTEKTTVLEFIFKFILKFIFNFILRVSSCEICEIFKRTFFTEHLQTTASAVGLLGIFFIGMCNMWKVLLLVTVHPFLLKLFSIDLLFSWYVSDRARNDFSFDDF